MKNILSPSILAADFNILGEQIRQTAAGGAEYLHFDVMDGRFVPSISFGPPVLAAIRETTAQVKDVHLMIEEPQRYIETFAAAGADIITVHYEACRDVAATLAAIRASGAKAGLTLRPGTDLAVLEPYLEAVDMILLMSVEPGFGGQPFMPAALPRIRALRARLAKRQLAVDIEVDGGLYLANVGAVLAAGANVIVAGSAIFHGDIRHNTEQFMEILKNE